jgi:aryl-alcohol dehydrogenase-like predicted oxidoreductase
VQIRSQLALAGVHPLEAALHYALARPEASAVVAGVTGLLELEALLAAARAPAPDLDWSDLRLDDPFALDPHRWAASSQRAA